MNQPSHLVPLHAAPSQSAPSLSAPSAQTLAAGLTEAADELGVLRLRVQQEGESQPHIDSTIWRGPASWACEVSLALLAREIAAVVDHLRTASDQATLEVWELRGRG